FASLHLRLDLDEHTGRHDEAVQCLNGPSGRLEYVDKALVRPNLELLTRLLVNMRRAQQRIALDPGRQRHRAAHSCVRPLGMIDDLARGQIQRTMIIGLHANTNSIALHGHRDTPPCYEPTSPESAGSSFITADVPLSMASTVPDTG